MRTFVLLLTLLFLLPCSQMASAGQTLTVFAAASLKGALDEIARAYETQSHEPLRLVFAGTSALARQIGQGAPADVFISANPAWMDVLARDNAIDPATRFDLAGNRLVMIQHGQTPRYTSLTDVVLKQADYVAVALTDAVPAGVYAREALQSVNLWAQVRHQLVQTDNVRAALQLVVMGEAHFGVVYQTDIKGRTGVTVIDTFPETSHTPIVYPAARVSASHHPHTDHLLSFLQSPQAQTILQQHGFLSRQTIGNTP